MQFFRKLFSLPRSKSGQLALPALIMAPIVVLLIYLLMETARLSAEKIHYQFALDTATYTSLTYPVGVLNGWAYMNGAMPARFWPEILMDPDFELDILRSDKATSGQERYTIYEIMKRAGDIIVNLESNNDLADTNWTPKDTDTVWKLGYKTGSVKAGMWNKENPDTAQPEMPYIFGNFKDPDYFNKGNDYMVEEIKLRMALMIYMMFSNIMEDTVLKHEEAAKASAKKSEYFRKAFSYNTSAGKDVNAGREGARIVKPFTELGIESIYLMDRVMMYVARQVSFGGQAQDIHEQLLTIELPDFIEENEKWLSGAKPQIYQFSYLNPATRKRLRELKKGVLVTQNFKAPDNYFKVDMNKYKPRVRVKTMVMCPNPKNNCVWPFPTPKYQVRLLP